MTLYFTQHEEDGGGVGSQPMPGVRGAQIIVNETETEIRFWFDPSRIATVYWLRPGESVMIETSVPA